jgi:S-methylmethionine-dependent homocysteine/selenocysteine methylase
MVPSALLLTDSGVETDLIFHQGVDLPLFAAFVVADSDEGRERLDRWHREHAAAATAHGLGISLDAVTWRASSDWGDQLGYDAEQLDRVNHELVQQLHDLRTDLKSSGATTPVLVGGVVGPRGDGYRPAERMSVEEAAAYHTPQLRSLLDAGVDRVSAMTIPYADEAAGIASAAGRLGLPVILGLTVETDGRLPDGTALADAVATVDRRTDGSAAGFMVNCAHPEHIAAALDAVQPEDTENSSWTQRVVALRPNASRRSHAELDEAPELDEGDPAELAAQLAELVHRLPAVTLVGGCCGTDVRHARAIAAAVTSGAG